MAFQAWKMKFLNSVILQVFHDQYEPCSETECSLLAEGSFPWYLAGGRKRDHLPNTREKRPHSGAGGGTLMLGNSGRGLDPRGVKAHSQSGKIIRQNVKIKTIYIGLRRNNSIKLHSPLKTVLLQNMGLP